jgi:hypothetical protein
MWKTSQGGGYSYAYDNDVEALWMDNGAYLLQFCDLVCALRYLKDCGPEDLARMDEYAKEILDLAVNC